MPTEQRITFNVEGEPMVGVLHRPDHSGAAPAVVVAGPMTSVKEQVTGVYAHALAARGIASLALDHRHYGESGGQPRQYEYYPHKVEDLRVALEVLGDQDDIDPSGLGLAGVCLGSGYALWAARKNPRVKAIGTVAGYYRDPEAMTAKDPEGFSARVEQGRAARLRYEASGEVETIPAAALEGDAAMTLQDTFDYYTRRAAHPNYQNAFAVMSREYFLPFDVQASAEDIEAPLQMVHSERALSPEWARAYHRKVKATLDIPPIRWLESRGQTDFYDDPQLVAAASDVLARHFFECLGQRGAPFVPKVE